MGNKKKLKAEAASGKKGTGEGRSEVCWREAKMDAVFRSAVEYTFNELM